MRKWFKVKGIEAVGILRGLGGYSLTPFGVGDPCVYCGGPAGTYEHITPRNKGGIGTGNRARACYRCNQERGSMPLLLFLWRRHNER